VVSPHTRYIHFSLKFNAIQISDWISELTQDERFTDKKVKFRKLAGNLKTVGFTQVIDDITEEIKDSLSNSPTLLRYVGYTGRILWDPFHVGYGFTPGPNAHRKVEGLTLDNDFAEALTIEEYAQELERMYDVDISLQPYLYKDGVRMIMPRGDESHSAWLKGHGYNKNTDKIVIVPYSAKANAETILRGMNQEIENTGNKGALPKLSQDDRNLIIASWVQSDDQLYTTEEINNAPVNLNLAHFLVFRQSLVEFLAEKRVISDRTGTAFKNIFGETFYNKITTRIKNKEILAPSHVQLELIYGRIHTEVVNKFGETYNEIMDYINFLFTLQYKIYGLEIMTPLARRAFQTFYTWAGIVKSYDETVNDNPTNLATRVMGKSRDSRPFDYIAEQLNKDKFNVRAQLDLIKNHIDTICSSKALSLNDLLRVELKKKLYFASKPLFDSLEALEPSRVIEPFQIKDSSRVSSIESLLKNLEERFGESPRLSLIEDIVSALNIPNINHHQFSLPNLSFTQIVSERISEYWLHYYFP
jgi:hypothetical protein